MGRFLESIGLDPAPTIFGLVIIGAVVLIAYLNTRKWDIGLGKTSAEMADLDAAEGGEH